MKYINVELLSVSEESETYRTTASLNVEGIALILNPVDSPGLRALPYEVGCEIQLFGMRGDSALHLVQTRADILDLIEMS